MVVLVCTHKKKNLKLSKGTHVNPIAQIKNNSNRLLIAMVVSSIISGCGGGNSDSTIEDGVALRDSDLTLYENEYQHRFWYDVKYKDDKNRQITFKVSEQSTAKNGEDFELTSSRSTSNNSGYFTLAIHDDDRFEGKQTIVIDIMVDGQFIREETITLDDTNSTSLTDHAAIEKRGAVGHGETTVVIDDTMYELSFNYALFKYDLLTHKTVKKREIAENTSIGSVYQYDGDIFSYRNDKIQRLNTDSLLWEIISTPPSPTNEMNPVGYAIQSTQVINDKLYLFGYQNVQDEQKPINFCYDFQHKKWKELSNRPHFNTFAQSAQFGNDVYLFRNGQAMIYNTSKDEWSTDPVEAKIGTTQPHVVGKYAYNFFVEDNAAYLSRFNLEKRTQEVQQVSNSQGGISWDIKGTFMYKGRIYLANNEDTRLLSAYWGDN